MTTLDGLKERLGEETKDLRLNLGNVLGGGSLGPKERYAVALTSALFLRAGDLAGAIYREGRDHLDDATVSDAKASAAIMAMNTVYYRFRHMIGKESYQHRQAGLRMSRMVRPATSKSLFELCSMACATLAGCEACIKAHEQSLLTEGMTEDQVNDAVRIAAVVHGFLVAASLPVFGKGES